MKKIKSFVCVALLSVFLTGNMFAADSVGGGFFSFFDSVMNAVVSMLRGDGDCQGKQCQTCKPKDDGSNGDCRPL
ncbi:MAG: hypothetical protein WA584_02165 [Pyrinomonadaceae bacterium]